MKKVKSCSSQRSRSSAGCSHRTAWVGGWLGRDGKGEKNCLKCYSMPGAAPALLPALGCRYGSLLFSPSAKWAWKTPVAVPRFNLFGCADASVSLRAYKLDQRAAFFFLTFFFNSSDPVYSIGFETPASAPLRQRRLWHSTRTKRLGGEEMTSQASFADEEHYRKAPWCTKTRQWSCEMLLSVRKGLNILPNICYLLLLRQVTGLCLP